MHLLASRFTEKALAQAITGSIVSEKDFKVHIVQDSKTSPRAMYPWNLNTFSQNNEDNQPYPIAAPKPAQGVDLNLGSMGKTHNPTSVLPSQLHTGMERKTSAGELHDVSVGGVQRQHNLFQNNFELNAKNRSYSQYRNFENRLTVRND